MRRGTAVVPNASSHSYHVSASGIDGTQQDEVHDSRPGSSPGLAIGVIMILVSAPYR
jgi:hypothetical protein